MSIAYPLLLFIHLAAILLLLLLHGAAVAVIFAIRDERRPERLAALLDLSMFTYDSKRWFGRLFWFDLLAVVFSGLALMILGGFWRHAWVWASILVFIAIIALMGSMGSGAMREVRKAAGLPWVMRSGFGPPSMMPPAGPAQPEAIAAAIAALGAWRLALAGGGGFLVPLWLMVYRPI